MVKEASDIADEASEYGGVPPHLRRLEEDAKMAVPGEESNRLAVGLSASSTLPRITPRTDAVTGTHPLHLRGGLVQIGYGPGRAYACVRTPCLPAHREGVGELADAISLLEIPLYLGYVVGW